MIIYEDSSVHNNSSKWCAIIWRIVRIGGRQLSKIIVCRELHHPSAFYIGDYITKKCRNNKLIVFCPIKGTKTNYC